MKKKKRKPISPISIAPLLLLPGGKEPPPPPTLPLWQGWGEASYDPSTADSFPNPTSPSTLCLRLRGHFFLLLQLFFLSSILQSTHREIIIDSWWWLGGRSVEEEMEIINSGDDAIYYFRVSSTNRNINNNKKERSQAIDWKQRGRRRRRRINFCQKLCKSRHLLICASTSSFAFRRLYLLVVGRGNLGVLPLNHIDKWCRGWRDEQRKLPRPSH